jgi:NAD(P)-dependent dehydrogenase (short-subunit alcohol dehydrogenase family)
MQLDQARAVVTGGASGLGFGVARHLLAHGARVALLDVNDEKGKAAAAELGERAHYFRTDVTSEDGVAATLAQAQQALGGLNVVVSCAGILGAGRVLGKEGPMALANFAATIGVNLIGSFNVAKAAAALMQHNTPGEDGERGVIVNTASIAAYDGQIGQLAYSASKGGVVGMTLPAARDLSTVGIRVCTIAPGLVDTPLLGTLPEEARQALSAGIPFPKRLGRPADFAELALDIIEHGYLNGEVFRMDGALRMAPR